MSEAQRSTDIVEDLSARAFLSLVAGVILLVLGGVMIAYKGMMMALGIVLTIIAAAALGYAIYAFSVTRKVGAVKTICPYCGAPNVFTEKPMSDFACRSCSRMVPIDNGVMLEVHQVRCGYCNALNYWSPRSFGLICEECSHEIPISGLEGGAHRVQAYAVKDDDQAYDLFLTGVGKNSEDLVAALQHILSLNRNQVKDIMANTPQLLLQGIPKKKAELLAAQLKMHDAIADIRPHTPS